jgi:hypothetical protein
MVLGSGIRDPDPQHCLFHNLYREAQITVLYTVNTVCSTHFKSHKKFLTSIFALYYFIF